MAAIALSASLMAAGGFAAPEPPAAHSDGPREAPPGEGMFCMAAIYSVVAEVGRRCFPDEDPAFVADMQKAVAKLDDFLLKNFKGTPADLAKFKREQGGVGVRTASLCRGDGVQLYRGLKQAGGAKILESVEKATARPGAPTWGDCL